VAEILLKLSEVHPDKPTNIAHTALFHATINGHVRVVKMLLERGDVSPDNSDGHDQIMIKF